MDKITDNSVNNPNSDTQNTQGITDNVVNMDKRIMNLKPFNPNLSNALTSDEAQRRGRIGGLKSGEVRRQKKTMRETLQEALTLELSADKLEELGADVSLLNGNNTVLSAIVASTIREAINGDTKAIQFVRDSIGEQPKQEITQEIITKEDTDLINNLTKVLTG